MKKIILSLMYIVCSAAAHGQNAPSNNLKNCPRVVFTAEEQAYWEDRVFVPIWKDSCSHTLMTGAELKCLFLRNCIMPTLDPSKPNDIENPLFDKILDDGRYGWELSIAPVYPFFKVPAGYQITYPKGCKY
jgi:hypothetical protein